MQETSAEGDPPSNGAAEGSVNVVKGQPEDEALQRKRHRPEGEGGQRFAPPGEGRSTVAVPAVRRYLLRHHHLNHRHLQNGVRNKRPKLLMQPSNSRRESKRRREHPEVPQAADGRSSGSSSSERSTDTQMGLVDVCTILCDISEAEGRCEGGQVTFDLTKWDFNKADCRNKCRKLVESSKPLFVIGSPIDSGQGKKERARGILHVAFILRVVRNTTARGRYFLHAHSHSADSWEQSKVVGFMNRFPDTFQTVTDRSLFGPNFSTV